VLVTGSSGFIGSHLVREMTDHGHEVVPFDVKREPFLEDALVEDNVARAIEESEPDVVVHLAAKVGRLFGERDLQATVMDNVAVTAVVARICGDAGVRMVYASTSEVYGDQGEAECFEDGPMAPPHNLYGLTKRFGEDVIRLYAPPLTALRFSMPYGPGLPPGEGRAALINFLWHAARHETVTVHRGSERSWCWIGDTVRATRIILEDDRDGIWNVGRDDNALPMRRVAEMACDLVGASHSLIREVDAPANQTVVKRLSTAKIASIGWQPEVDLAEGMERTWAWLREEHV
jgi:nucleoside-diphosphate-sugar epimerase